MAVTGLCHLCGRFRPTHTRRSPVLPSLPGRMYGSLFFFLLEVQPRVGRIFPDPRRVDHVESMLVGVLPAENSETTFLQSSAAVAFFPFEIGEFRTDGHPVLVCPTLKGLPSVTEKMICGSLVIQDHTDFPHANSRTHKVTSTVVRQQNIKREIGHSCQSILFVLLNVLVQERIGFRVGCADAANSQQADFRVRSAECDESGQSSCTRRGGNNR